MLEYQTNAKVLIQEAIDHVDKENMPEVGFQVTNAIGSRSRGSIPSKMLVNLPPFEGRMREASLQETERDVVKESQSFLSKARNFATSLAGLHNSHRYRSLFISTTGL